MRHLILIILIFCLSCGEESAKPIKKEERESDFMIGDYKMLEEDMGGSMGGMECSSECLKENLINMLQVEKDIVVAQIGGVQFKEE